MSQNCQHQKCKHDSGLSKILGKILLIAFVCLLDLEFKDILSEVVRVLNLLKAKPLTFMYNTLSVGGYRTCFTFCGFGDKIPRFVSLKLSVLPTFNLHKNNYHKSLENQLKYLCFLLCQFLIDLSWVLFNTNILYFSKKCT